MQIIIDHRLSCVLNVVAAIALLLKRIFGMDDSVAGGYLPDRRAR